MTRPPLPSHYEVLELGCGATAEELRRSFRALSKRYHPDTTSLPPAEAEEAFRRLRQAYAVLADPEARRRYDDRLRRPSPPLAPPPAAMRPPLRADEPGLASVRRALSGGEWFALLLLGLALLLSLVLGIGLAWARGAELVTLPSWWGELQASGAPAGAMAAGEAPPAPAPAPVPVSPAPRP
jgi:plasmid stabilization system protein ParE